MKPDSKEKTYNVDEHPYPSIVTGATPFLVTLPGADATQLIDRVFLSGKDLVTHFLVTEVVSQKNNAVAVRLQTITDNPNTKIDLSHFFPGQLILAR